MTVSKKTCPADIIVAALYRFFRFKNYAEFRNPLLNFCIEQKLKGTVLLAPEGINGTVAGDRNAIDRLKDFLESTTFWRAWNTRNHRRMKSRFIV